MKKFLLSCFLALGVAANAQYNFLGDFEGDDLSIYGQFGGGTVTAAAACNGSWGGQLATSATVTQTGWMLELDALQGQTNNGQQATVSIKYKKASGPVGTLYLTLFEYDAESDAWDIVPIIAGVSLTSAATTTCSTLQGVIPAGTLQADKSYAVGGFYVRTSGSGNIYIDDISIVQDVVTTIPGCGALTAPTNSATVNAGTYNFTWSAVPTAVTYKLTVGSAAGGSDIYSGTIPGNITSQYVGLGTNKTYYAKLVPSNANGSATGCTEISFNTNSTIGYCSATAPTYTNTAYEIISRVQFADIDNSSPTTAGTPGYEDFTSKVGNVNVGQTYPITVTVKGFDTDKTSVWIDYNQDGIFTDNERTDLTNAASSTGSIVIPTTAKAGNTRMRVAMNYSTAPVACGTQSYGQIEDYTLNIKVPTTPPDCTTFTYPATNGATGVTPNPAPLTWTAKEAIAYKVYIGTTSGGTDIANGVVVTTNAYSPTLATNTTYYAKVVPYNVVGDATSCSEISFTTGNVVYCTATTSQTTGEKISRVQFSDIDQSSTATTGYEDYTSVTGNISQGATVPITVTVSAATNANEKVSVWIDYNQNGTFEDSERTNLTYTNGNTSVPGSVVVPIGAKAGTTRMRVRLNRATSVPVACGSVTTQGQTEDYTINIVEVLPACTVITTPADGATGVAINPTLKWTAVDNAKGYKLYLGTTSGGTDVLNGVSVTSGASYNASSLANNTMYYAKVVSYNGKGDATGCSETTFTTIVALPSCATLSSPANGATGVAVNPTLSWSAVSGATGYKLYLGTTSGGSDVLSGVDVTTGTSYDVSSLANNTMYYAKIVAYNVAGDATGCSETTFTTIVALPSCTTLSAPANGTTGVVTNPTLTWPSVSGATGYKLSLGTTSGGTDVLNAVDVTGTSYNVPSLALNTMYYAKVVPYNAAGNATGCSETTFTTSAMAVSDVNKANISVYPNPFTDVLKISDVKGIKSISVNDVSGRLVKSLEPSIELNLSSLKSGMYIINLNMEDGTVKSLKAIKK